MRKFSNFQVSILAILALCFAFGAPSAFAQTGSPEVSASIDALMEKVKKNEKHPWANGNPSSGQDWEGDSEKVLGDNFSECLEASKVEDSCDYCDDSGNGFFVDDNCTMLFYNPGMVIEYWWPELEIEINDFGISSINPIANGKTEYARQQLIDGIQKEFRKDLDKYLKNYGVDKSAPAKDGAPKGYTSYRGLTAPDQTLVNEAHMYLTHVQDEASKLRTQGYGYCGELYQYIYNECVEIQDFWFNGYEKGNSWACFYDTLEPESDTPIKAWTEDPAYAKYWRIPFNSNEISPEFYKASTPFILSGDWNSDKKKLLDKKFNTEDSCASYRVAKWPEQYGELEKLAGIKGKESSPNDILCYKGGGQLFPLSGTLSQHFNDLSASAYLARRAIELIGHIGETDDSVNKFTRMTTPGDEIDKLQRVYPEETPCFKMKDVDEANEDLFPKDLVKPEHNGSIRYIYWNKRTACLCEMRGDTSATEKDAGQDTCGNSQNKGWGCQIYEKGEEDDARGNVEEDDIEGTKDSSVESIIKRYFPFDDYASPTIYDMQEQGPDSGGGAGGF